MESNSSQKSNMLVRPKINSDEVKQIIFNLYGLTVNKISELNGYDDKNFHILVNLEVNNNEFIDNILDCGYVLKVINSLDSQDERWLDAQTKLLLHLNKSNIRCPKPIFTKDQKPFQKIQLSSGEHIVRLLEYISGEIVFKIQATPKLFYDVGLLTAKMDNALQTFDHPAYHRNIQWCLGSAPKILNYLDAVKDEERKTLVRQIIDEFSVRVLAIEDKLDKGLIHGDINEQNLIVEQANDHTNIKAVIDFGDAHYACYLYELTIAMTYMIFTSNQIDSGGFVLAGYSSAKSVSEQELKLLRICVLTRFCQSLVLGAYASLQEPENDYILTTSRKGWQLLEIINKMSESALLDLWTSVITP